MNIVFWNLKKAPVSTLLCQLANEGQADLIVLAESTLDISATLRELQTVTGHTYANGLKLPMTGRISLLHKKDLFAFGQREASDHWEVMELRYCSQGNPSNQPPFILAAAHLPSPVRTKPTTTYDICQRFSRAIRGMETSQKHSRTVAVGDFNLNPFDEGIVSHSGLHAVMSREIARQDSRIVARESSPFFYNPMWRLMGGGDRGALGTYYYRGSDSIEIFWHTIDQVLFRPTLLDAVDDSSIQIITQIGTTPLDVKTNKRLVDHYPLFFQIDHTKL